MPEPKETPLFSAWDMTCVETMLNAYRTEHDFERDQDPTATNEMLSAVATVNKHLRIMFPICRACDMEYVEATGQVCGMCFVSQQVIVTDDDGEMPY